MYKFDIGEYVKKAKGYRFTGVVVSRYEVDGGIRYDVQVDAMPAFNYVKKIHDEGIINDAQYSSLSEFVMNCHGMIHIFSEEQLQSDI